MIESVAGAIARPMPKPISACAPPTRPKPEVASAPESHTSAAATVTRPAVTTTFAPSRSIAVASAGRFCGNRVRENNSTLPPRL